MNIGHQKWYQKEHFAYMKMGYQTMYVNTHTFMGIIITLSHIWTAWKSATFLTMGITYMTTSNDEELPGLERSALLNSGLLEHLF